MCRAAPPRCRAPPPTPAPRTDSSREDGCEEAGRLEFRLGVRCLSAGTAFLHLSQPNSGLPEFGIFHDRSRINPTSAGERSDSARMRGIRVRGLLTYR